MTLLQKLLLAFSAIAITASLLEGLILSLRRPGTYDWKATGASLLVAVGRSVTDQLLPVAIAIPFGYWLYEHRMLDAGIDTWWGIALLFIGLEFCYYWFHRASHRVRWFWATHSVHHSPNQLNLSAAYRLGWTGKLSLALLFMSPLALLGFTPQTILFAFSINLLYQFWIHAAWVPRLGPLEWILNTPSAHRVHHAANLDYLDANYGGVLIVFDRLFGTYIPERADLPCRYGLVKPLTSHNPFMIAFHHWIALVADVRRARSLREALGYLFGPPGWVPDGPGSTTEAMREQARGSVGAGA
ncbi:MAG: sterol desaturase family protein [Betaproteobacteria bacterium]|nr:sterol desaturase family protein [Betaproteobacteria bacterium]